MNAIIKEKSAAGDYGAKAQNISNYPIDRKLKISVAIKNLPDGDNQAPPEFIKALGDSFGIQTDGSFKGLIDVYGSIFKTVYSANSDLYDPETNTVTVVIGNDTIKRLSSQGVKWAKNVLENTNYYYDTPAEVDAQEFLSFHALHAGTCANNKKARTSSQGDSSKLIRTATVGRIKRGSIRFDQIINFSGNIRDAFFQAFRRVQSQQEGTSFVYTATAARDSGNKVDILSDTVLSKMTVTYDNIKAATVMYPNVYMEVGIRALANLAAETNHYKSNKANADVVEAIKAVHDHYNELRNIELTKNGKRFEETAHTLLSYLSDDKIHQDGVHIFKTKVNEEDVYFMGVNRSPTPREVPPFIPVRAILNTREEGIRLSDAAIKRMGGDFDGDLVLGLPPITYSDLVNAVSLSRYGSASNSKVKEVGANLGYHLFQTISDSIIKDENYKPFVNSLISDVSHMPGHPLHANENLFDGTMALSGVIKNANYAKVLLHSMSSGEWNLPSGYTKEINNLIDKLASKGQIEVGEKKLETPFEIPTRKNIESETRVVFVQGSSSTKMTQGKLIELRGAIGSNRLVATFDAGNTGEGGNRRTVMVTEQILNSKVPEAKSYSTFILERVPEKLGLLKVVSVLSSDPEDSGNQALIVNRANALSQTMKSGTSSELVTLNQNIYVGIPQTVLETVNSALVDTKVNGQRIIQNHYPNSPNDFIKDAIRFISELYAASVVDTTIWLGNDQNNVADFEYALSGLMPTKTDYHISSNASFREGSSRIVIDSLSNIFEDNINDINTLVQMTRADNSIPLETQSRIKKNFTLPATSRSLPSDVIQFMQLDDAGGVGWAPQFGYNRIVKDSKLFKEFDETVMSPKNPLSNKVKINLHSDLSKSIRAVENILSNLTSVSDTEFNSLYNRLQKEALYIDNNASMDRDGLTEVVYEVLVSKNQTVSLKVVRNILRDLGVEKSSPETFYAVKKPLPITEIGTELKNSREANTTKVRISKIVDSKGNAITMFSLADILHELINNKDLLKNKDQRYLINLKTVFNGFIDVLSPDSRLRAISAGNGMTKQTFFHIREMYKNNNIIHNNTTGGYKIKLEGLIDVNEAENIPLEDRYKINSRLKTLQKFNEADLVDETNKTFSQKYMTEGEGDC